MFTILSNVRWNCNKVNFVDKGIAIKDDEKLPNDDFGNNMEIHSQVMGSPSPMLKGTFMNWKKYLKQRFHLHIL